MDFFDGKIGRNVVTGDTGERVENVLSEHDGETGEGKSCEDFRSISCTVVWTSSLHDVEL